MNPSKNVIEQTWLAYAFEGEGGMDRVRAGLDRVEEHYQGLISDPLARGESCGALHGLALWRRRDRRLRWPLWCQSDELSAAFAAAPTGWGKVVGELPVADVPAALARCLLGQPERLVELAPPFVLGVRDSNGERLTIINDALGIGRLYELRTREGWVWSNRLGALPIFAGIDPEPDLRAWRIFAAAGWFLGDAVPIRGARKVRPGTAIVIEGRGSSLEVSHRETTARRTLVEQRRAWGRRSASRAAEELGELGHELGAMWSAPFAISLTGGRDSRISAAVALATGLEASFNTGDQVPGELDVVRELIAAAPRRLEHHVSRPGQDESIDDLRARLRAIHLVHDGLRNPQEVRRPMVLPTSRWPPPTMSGHGGEIGHGFYYTTSKKLRRIERAGEQGLLEQLNRSARRRHAAATEDAYAAYLEECEACLEQGRSYGVRGANLLDWFYLAQRLAHRSGLGARSGRYSACVTPAFVRAAFDLSPRERLANRLHRRVVARLLPAWREVPFFISENAPMPEIHRPRIWERPEEAGVVEEKIKDGGSWTEIFEAGRVKEMWREVRAGGGSADYEHVFYRVLWRAAFDEHLRTLRRAATERASRSASIAQ